MQFQDCSRQLESLAIGVCPPGDAIALERPEGMRADSNLRRLWIGANHSGDPPALLRNSIDGHQVESEFSGLGVKPC